MTDTDSNPNTNQEFYCAICKMCPKGHNHVLDCQTIELLCEYQQNWKHPAHICSVIVFLIRGICVDSLECLAEYVIFMNIEGSSLQFGRLTDDSKSQTPVY